VSRMRPEARTSPSLLGVTTTLAATHAPDDRGKGSPWDEAYKAGAMRCLRRLLRSPERDANCDQDERLYG
jgi:hypothetical protein